MTISANTTSLIMVLPCAPPRFTAKSPHLRLARLGSVGIACYACPRSETLLSPMRSFTFEHALNFAAATCGTETRRRGALGPAIGPSAENAAIAPAAGRGERCA
jgi:hypothetical protein